MNPAARNTLIILAALLAALVAGGLYLDRSIGRSLTELGSSVSGLVEVLGNDFHRIERLDSVGVHGRPVVFRGDTVALLRMAFAIAPDTARHSRLASGSRDSARMMYDYLFRHPGGRIVYLAELRDPRDTIRLRAAHIRSARLPADTRSPLRLDAESLSSDSTGADLWLSPGRIRLPLILEGTIEQNHP